MSINISPGDLWEFKLHFLAGDTNAFNVIHYKVTQVNDQSTGLPAAIAPPLAPQASTIGAAMIGYFAPTWQDFAVNSVQFLGVGVQSILPSPRSRYWFTQSPVEIFGTLVGDALPLQDTPTLLKKSEYGERTGLGRIFAVGLGEGSQQGGVLTNVAEGLLADFADQFQQTRTIIGVGYNFVIKPVIYNRGAALGVNSTDIFDVQLSDSIIKTQRRRRPGKGI